LTLDLVTDEQDETRPWFIPFTDDARALMDDFRLAVRGWEGEAEGLMLSFLGKLPGLCARLALVLAFLDWAAEGAEEPASISVQNFGRAAHLVEAYFCRWHAGPMRTRQPRRPNGRRDGWRASFGNRAGSVSIRATFCGSTVRGLGLRPNSTRRWRFWKMAIASARLNRP